MFYLVLGHCMQKMTSIGGDLNKNKNLAMTRDIEVAIYLGMQFYLKSKKLIFGSKIQTVDVIIMPSPIIRKSIFEKM